MTENFHQIKISVRYSSLKVIKFDGLSTSGQSLSTVNRLVAKLTKLTHLDISRNGYSFMPSSCSWPSTLRFLNISRTKLTNISPCLPTSLEVDRLDHEENNPNFPTPSHQDHLSIHFVLHCFQVLDLNNNDLSAFTLPLPALRELYLSGNKFLRLPSGQLFPNLQTLTIQVRNSHI